MTKLPSEIIGKRALELSPGTSHISFGAYLEALIEYLDEQYEKEQCYCPLRSSGVHLAACKYCLPITSTVGHEKEVTTLLKCGCTNLQLCEKHSEQPEEGSRLTRLTPGQIAEWEQKIVNCLRENVLCQHPQEKEINLADDSEALAYMESKKMISKVALLKLLEEIEKNYEVIGSLEYNSGYLNGLRETILKAKSKIESI